MNSITFIDVAIPVEYWFISMFYNEYRKNFNEEKTDYCDSQEFLYHKNLFQLFVEKLRVKIQLYQYDYIFNKTSEFDSFYQKYNLDDNCKLLSKKECYEESLNTFNISNRVFLNETMFLIDQMNLLINDNLTFKEL